LVCVLACAFPPGKRGGRSCCPPSPSPSFEACARRGADGKPVKQGPKEKDGNRYIKKKKTLLSISLKENSPRAPSTRTHTQTHRCHLLFSVPLLAFVGGRAEGKREEARARGGTKRPREKEGTGTLPPKHARPPPPHTPKKAPARINLARSCCCCCCSRCKRARGRCPGSPCAPCSPRRPTKRARHTARSWPGWARSPYIGPARTPLSRRRRCSASFPCTCVVRVRGGREERG